MYGNTEPGIDGNGLFFRNSHVRLREITDGTSHTIAVGERSHALGEATWVGSVTGAALDARSGRWNWNFEVEHGSTMVLGHTGEDMGPGDPRGEADMFHSFHGDGANFVFADGHVAFLATDVAPVVFEALATRAPVEKPSRESFEQID